MNTVDDVLLNSVTRKKILKKIIESGLQIAPDALDLIAKSERPVELVDSVIQSGIDSTTMPVISQELIKEIIAGHATREIIPRAGQGSKEAPQGHVSSGEDIVKTEEHENDYSWDVHIIKNPTVESVCSLGTVMDFHELFKDRFSRIRRIYMSRIDTRNAISIRAAIERKREAYATKTLKRKGGRRQKQRATVIIGMVKNKTISKSRNIILEIEDQETSMICVIPSGRKGLQGKELIKKGNSVLLDEVVCVSGYVDQDGRLIADDVIFPDIPAAREIGRARRDVYAAFISDIHCGSNEFLEEEFDRFVDWLKGIDVPDEKKDLVSKTEYLFIAGDLVDGVGVYPGQEKDLAIPSIHDQYALLASKLKRLPQRIKIIAIPGNHDACRQALPKPPIPEEFAEALYALGKRITMLGDPSVVAVEGVKVLLTHGDSLDDLVTQIPGASYKDPALPMIELLKKRHLVPLYGGKTELAPVHRDWMVIETVPEIVHFGHAHHNAVNNYRGVQVINSGTFQDQTDFMKKQGVVPTPGIVTLINLRNGAPAVETFYDFSRLEQ